MKKYTEGKALIIVIIIMAMLLILAPAIVISSNTEISQTTRYDNRMQAYLYARSGIDAALGWLIQEGELNSDFKAADSYNGTAFMKGSIESMNIADSPLTGESAIDVSMSYMPNGVLITSTGLFNGYSREIMLTLALTTIESPSFVIPDKALFLQNDEEGNTSVFELIGSPGIIGDFGANTETEDALHFGNQEYITGNIYLAASDDSVMDAIDPDGVLSGDIVYNAPKIYYPAPGFPVTPSLGQYPETSGLVSSAGDLMNNTDGAELNLDGNYSFGDFEVKKLLNINLNDGDKDIVVENLIISGNVNLINRGASGKLSIHVTNSIIFSGNVTMNSGAEGGDYESLNIFYSGAGTPEFNGSTKIFGSFVTLTSDFDIRGNNEVVGHIIVGGTSAYITGTSELDTRLIYAPNAHVTITGTADCSGAIVADTAVVTGNGDIVYQAMDIGSLPPGIFPDPNDPGYIDGLTTEIISTYYWE